MLNQKGQPEVVTAPLESVLEGTILKMVRSICEKENIPFSFRYISINSVNEWQGAFITSK